MRFRLLLAAAALSSGLFLSISSAMHGAWLPALLWFVSGMLVIGALVWQPSWFSWDLWNTAGATLTTIAIFGLLASHPAADFQLQKAHGRLGARFTSIEQYCPGANGGITSLATEGVLSCALQPLSDQTSLVRQTAEAQLGPGSSLLYGTFLASEDPNTDRCLAAYAKARVLCPDAFLDIERELPDILASARSADVKKDL